MTDSQRWRRAALDEALRGMFRKLEARPLPDHLRSVVDQLAEGEAKTRKVAAQR